MLPSPISHIELEGRKLYVKRDDLIDPFLAGNKFRKFYSLLQTPSEKYTTLISYGGTQSNAMLALASLCQKKKWKFIYYSKPLSKVQKEENEGNLFESIQLGMEHIIIEYELYRDFIASLRVTIDESTFIIDQGGADILAKEGIRILADEIRNNDLGIKSLALPSGTGTTALFLAVALPEYKVYTTAVIGDACYLRVQMQALNSIPKNLIILENTQKYPFGKPQSIFLNIYEKFLACGIEFDLLYAPLMWKNLLESVPEKFIYIHSGGVSGNKSMLKRYAL
ncbi:1-aminocyclopropane-1-carboxylate deaminase [Sulfurimonas sp. SAG-AH-194-I05]|nr:1-aminocyclopropane-1-carboxylate deaminase [Sulfurimonas sp. SAG-AH-194-I05]MDF1874345.1 1-aminocyclopropane-1-carboxylate deaminase [Sulfurimonas sp. SAG-AH-194-I05]